MKTNKNLTIVVFRKWRPNKDQDEGIIALFPYEIYNNTGLVNSYEHIGQHGGADYQHCILNTVPAKAYEYNELKSILEGIGYDLEVIQRYSRKRYLHELYEAIKK